MPTPTPASLESEPDLAVLEKLAIFERMCLIAVFTIAGANLAIWCIPSLGHRFATTLSLMPPESSVAALLSALSLLFSGPHKSNRLHRLSQVLAAIVAMLALTILAGTIFKWPAGSDVSFARYPVFPYILPGMALETAAGFSLLGLTLIFVRLRGRASSVVADILAVILVLLTLILVSGHLLAEWHVFGPTERVKTSSQSMVCLFLLTQGVFFRRAEHGIFSILLGSGMASRVARVFAPILLVFPFLREAGRAEFVGSGKMPPHYTTAILASVNVVLALFMLLYLAWRLNRMETEVRELTLRDALTGLYNIRGFRILAEQSLRMAHRSKEPFSVLFIDIDELKQINDILGHQAGSEFLIETADILKDTFRETDILGRIGGDEFAVAGQFSYAAISDAARRLEEGASRHNRDAGRRFGLQFSIGHVTSEVGMHESLDELLAKADEAMYEEKRRRKVAVS